MESLKINYVMYGTGRTGGTRVLFNFMNELVKQGHEVSLTTIYYDDWFPLTKDIKIISKRTRFNQYLLYGKSRIFESNQLLYHLDYMKKLHDMIPKVDINVATFSPTAYVASWKSIDGSTPFYHMQHLETIMFSNPLMKKFILDTYFLPIYKVANSKWLQQKLRLIVGTEFAILNPAIEHDIFYRRNVYQQDGRNINIIALGKGGWKNAIGIYNAVNLVRSKLPNKKIILHFFGQRPINGIKFDNRETIFHKNLSDDQLAELYSNSDIQVTFSTAESFPLPPLEAMACGSAVITTPYGTEDYVIDGLNALIVEPNNVEMLADKIRLLIEDEELRQKLIENGFKTASKFNYPEQTKILIEQFKQALNQYQNSYVKEMQL
ncbi:MAG: glycosyltransferase family 4 protein [Thermoproteota archaeon]